MLKVTGLDTTLKKLQNAAKAYEISVTEAKKNFVWTVFRDIVVHTPQWSGNLAANWYIEVGNSSAGTSTYSQIASYKDDADYSFYKGVSPFAAGMNPAVDSVLQRESSKLSQMDTIHFGFGSFTKQVPHVRWNSKIRIVNTTGYAEEVEAGIAPPDTDGIRPENLYKGPNVPAHGVAMVEYAVMKYSKHTYLRPSMGGIFNNNIRPQA